MTEFPTILYKCPGIWPGNGYSFATRPANDQTEFDAALADGWHPTVPQAVEAWRKPVAVQTTPEPSSVPPDDAAPTRAELEQKATELGIKFDGRTGDKTLLKKIEEALAPKEPAGDVDQA